MEGGEKRGRATGREEKTQHPLNGPFIKSACGFGNTPHSLPPCIETRPWSLLKGRKKRDGVSHLSAKPEKCWGGVVFGALHQTKKNLQRKKNVVEVFP